LTIEIYSTNPKYLKKLFAEKILVLMNGNPIDDYNEVLSFRKFTKITRRLKEEGY